MAPGLNELKDLSRKALLLPFKGFIVNKSRRLFQMAWFFLNELSSVRPIMHTLIEDIRLKHNKMTSSNKNIFRVTDPLCREFTGPRWIPRTKASDAEL